VPDVKVRGHAAHVRRRQGAGALVVPDEPALVEAARGGAHQLDALALQHRVGAALLEADAVRRGVAEHPHEEVRVGHPDDGLAHVGHAARHDFGVEVVGQGLDEGGLDRRLAQQPLLVVGQLVRRGDDASLALRVELRAARSAEDLKHVQHGQVHETAGLGVVHVGALDDDGVRREVDAPGQRGRAAEHLDFARHEQLFREVAVAAEHAGVVDADAHAHKLAQLVVLALAQLPQQREHLARALAAGRAPAGLDSLHQRGLPPLRARLVHGSQHVLGHGLEEGPVSARQRRQTRTAARPRPTWRRGTRSPCPCGPCPCASARRP